MAKKIRPPFDINKEFIVNKPFNENGHAFIVGDVFPWRRISCSARNVYKYWGLRWLECKSEKNIKGVNFEEPEPERVKETIKVKVSCKK